MSNRETTARIHHLAFHNPGEAATHGVRTVRLQIPKESIQEDIAEWLFEATNRPGEHPKVISSATTGRCYSMSTGDVAETAEGSFFLCCGCDWKELSEVEFKLLIFAQKEAYATNPRWAMDFDGVRLIDSLRERDRLIETEQNAPASVSAVLLQIEANFDTLRDQLRESSSLPAAVLAQASRRLTEISALAAGCAACADARGGSGCEDSGPEVAAFAAKSAERTVRRALQVTTEEE